jgi:hypothetical protein
MSSEGPNRVELLSNVRCSPRWIRFVDATIGANRLGPDASTRGDLDGDQLGKDAGWWYRVLRNSPDTGTPQFRARFREQAVRSRSAFSVRSSPAIHNPRKSCPMTSFRRSRLLPFPVVLPLVPLQCINHILQYRIHSNPFSDGHPLDPIDSQRYRFTVVKEVRHQSDTVQPMSQSPRNRPA